VSRKVIPLPVEYRRPPRPTVRRPQPRYAPLYAFATIFWLGCNALFYFVVTSVCDFEFHWAWHPHWFGVQAILCVMGIASVACAILTEGP
jgi:hypothetical protein